MTWYSEKFLNKTINIKIDRTLWSKHPKRWFEYNINYWFVPNTKAPDWEELDAYLLWVNKPVKEFTWKCIAIIKRTNDDDDKLIITPNWENFSDEEIRKQTEFQEKFFESKIIR